jgi:hypothetical protein
LGDETEEMWRRLCLSAEDLPGFEAWGAFCDGQLQGSFLAFQCDDVYTLPYQQSATAYLQFRINNALFFHVTREVIRRPGISAVYFGLEPLTDSSRGDHFKFSMGLTARAIRQRVVFHPWLAPVLARPTCLAAKWFLGQRRQAALAKAAGMLRFYREGNRPPAEQEWPACLDGQRNVLLTTLCSQSSEDS